MTRLSDAPHIHPTASVSDSTLGRYTEVGAGCHVAHSTLGDYSYCVENTQIAYATIGKFANIAAHVRSTTSSCSSIGVNMMPLAPSNMPVLM